MFKIILISAFLLLTTGLFVERKKFAENQERTADKAKSQGNFSYFSSSYSNHNGNKSGEQTAVSGGTEDGKVDSGSVKVSHKTLKDGEVTADSGSGNEETDAKQALKDITKSRHEMEDRFDQMEADFDDMFDDFW